MHSAQVPESMDAHKYLTLWFLGAPYESIRRGNLEDLVAYGEAMQEAPLSASLHPSARQPAPSLPRARRPQPRTSSRHAPARRPAGFWYTTPQQLRDEGKGGVLEAQVQQLQEAFDMSAPEGHNPQLRFMSHLWDDLKVMWRWAGSQV
jgi:hypothetical protein